MRGDDDDAQGDGSSGGPLAEGLGETVEPGVPSSTSDTYGDVDDTYGSDTYGSDTTTGDTSTDDTYDGDTYGDESDTTTDDSYVDDSYGNDTYGEDGSADDGTFGDGDGADDGTDLPQDTTTDGDVDTDLTVDESLEVPDLVTESESPLDGMRYVLDELHDALFGEDEDTVGEAVGSGLETDPAELETDTDLDLNGDGVVDPADLHQLLSPFDFDAG
jgi:hypothetical protein